MFSLVIAVLLGGSRVPFAAAFVGAVLP